MKVLYVEDNPNDAELVVRYMATTPHNIVVVPDVHTIGTKDTASADLILVDVMIANERVGYDFARQLRQDGYQRPVIAITALNTPQDQQDCAEAGFDAVLTKPFNITQLDQMIRRYTHG